MQRNLKQCSSTLIIQAYFSYVRPIIEYASTVWSPHNMCDIQKLEMIQHKAICFVFNDFSRYSSVTSMINNLQWTTLKLRRNSDKIIMFYKMLTGLVSLEFLNSLQPNTSCTHGHNLRYRQVSTRIDAYLHSYLPSTIQLWNSLPPEVVHSQSLSEFKNNVYVHYTQ